MQGEALLAPRVVEIAPGVWQVGGPQLTAPEDVAIYLIDGGTGAAIVDAGCGSGLDRLCGNIEEAGVPLDRVDTLLLTHCHFDHTGGARSLSDRLGLTVVAHELDAPYIEAGDIAVTAATWYGARLEPCEIDRWLSGAETDVEIGGRTITALHIPGHSPGSVAYVMDADGQRIVFAQDVHGPLHPSLKSNWADYRASLERLMALESDVLCEGHYGIFRGRDEIDPFIRSFLVRA